MNNLLKTFSQRFSCDDDCLKYLASIKWPSEKFECRRCGNTTYHHGRTPYSRRCNKCKRDESVTSGTMFEKIKFPILTAFSIIFRLATQDTGISSTELAEMLGIQTKTCLAFRYKVQQAIKTIEQKPLNDAVGLGVFNIVNTRSEYWWRRDTPEQRIAVAAEIKGTKVNRAFAWVMKDGTAYYMSKFIKHYIHPEAHIFLIERYGYKQLQREHKLLTMVREMKLLNEHFNMLRRSLLSENHSYSFEHLQGYLDEYHFRFNHQQNNHRNFDMIMRMMVREKCDDNK